MPASPGQNPRPLPVSAGHARPVWPPVHFHIRFPLCHPEWNSPVNQRKRDNTTGIGPGLTVMIFSCHGSIFLSWKLKARRRQVLILSVILPVPAGHQVHTGCQRFNGWRRRHLPRPQHVIVAERLLRQSLRRMAGVFLSSPV